MSGVSVSYVPDGEVVEMERIPVHFKTRPAVIGLDKEGESVLFFRQGDKWFGWFKDMKDAVECSIIEKGDWLQFVYGDRIVDCMPKYNNE